MQKSGVGLLFLKIIAYNNHFYYCLFVFDRFVQFRMSDAEMQAFSKNNTCRPRSVILKAAEEPSAMPPWQG
jgi:hypothetical protein